MHDLESHDHVESGASLLKGHQTKLGQLLLVSFLPGDQKSFLQPSSEPFQGFLCLVATKDSMRGLKFQGDSEQKCLLISVVERLENLSQDPICLF